jgi:hypothetical protein
MLNALFKNGRSGNVVLEQLMFAIHPSVVEDWLKFEEDCWKPWLCQQRGYVSKQIDVRNGVAINKIWWKDRASWDEAATKKKEIAALDLKMRQLFGSRVLRLKSN